MKIFKKEISPMKIIAGIGIIISVFFGIINLYKWYIEKTIVDVSGSWKLTYVIEQSSLERYKGLQLEYAIFMKQDGDVLKGIGDKISEDGQVLSTSARTPIQVEGTIDGENIQLSVTENGKKRDSHGMITLKITDNEKILEGIFTTDAANCSGRCTVECR